MKNLFSLLAVFCLTNYSLALDIKIDVRFDSGKAVIKPEFHQHLEKISKIIKSTQKAVMSIEGHTDSSGNLEKNRVLSEARALSVKTYIIRNFGVSPQRVMHKGFGPKFPIKTNATLEGRSANRRVIGVFVGVTADEELKIASAANSVGIKIPALSKVKKVAKEVKAVTVPKVIKNPIAIAKVKVKKLKTQKIKSSHNNQLNFYALSRMAVFDGSGENIGGGIKDEHVVRSDTYPEFGVEWRRMLNDKWGVLLDGSFRSLQFSKASLDSVPRVGDSRISLLKGFIGGFYNFPKGLNKIGVKLGVSEQAFYKFTGSGAAIEFDKELLARMELFSEVRLAKWGGVNLKQGLFIDPTFYTYLSGDEQQSAIGGKISAFYEARFHKRHSARVHVGYDYSERGIKAIDVTKNELFAKLSYGIFF